MRSLPRILLAAAAWLLMSANAAPAVAALTPIVLDASTHRALLEGKARYWIDPTGNQTVDQVEQAGDSLPWQVRSASERHNLDGGKAMWIEFEAIRKDTSRWFVEIELSGLDRVQYFHRDAAGAWVVQEAGDTRPVLDWPLPGRFPTFELATRVGEPVRYFLRIEHARVDFGATIALHDQGELLASRELQQFLLGGYFGLAVLIAAVSLAHAAAFRDRNFLAYAIYVVTLALYQAAYLGVGAEHLWPYALRWNEVATFVLPGISTAAALWFTKVVTEPARYSPMLDLAVWSVIAALLAATGLDAFLWSRGSFVLVLGLTLVAMAVVALLIALVWREGEDPLIRIIALGFLPVLVAALLPLARGLNLLPTTVFTRYALAAGAGLEMPILYYALTLRGARRREAQMRASGLSKRDPLTGLASRAALEQRVEASLGRTGTLKHTAALLGVRIANFEAIVSEFGRETADRALVVAASLLRRSIADIDFAARVGERDFLVLLEGPTTTEAAQSCAQQLVAGGLRASEALPAAATIKFHVTVAKLPEHDRDARSTVQWMLDAVNESRPDARKLIRTLNF